MDKRWCKRFVQLAYRIADFREDFCHKFQRRVASVHQILECFAHDIFHDHNQICIALIAFMQTRNVSKMLFWVCLLHTEDALVGLSKAGIVADGFSNERTALKIVGHSEINYFSAFKIRLF